MQRIFNVIREYHMIEQGMRVIAGVSGGADSVCLLYVLNEYRKQVPFELMAVHVEHGIRGEDSLADAHFTQELCGQLQIPCRTVSVPVQRIAKEQGLSLEEAGRMERYRIFEEIRAEWNADRIAVAHNQNDQAETVLWNLVRGSGLKGLGGIRPVREHTIRPLLFTKRAEIEDILTAAGLEWRTDRTNLETDYTRNRIRLTLLPMMERELNAGAAGHIAQAAQKLQAMQEFLECMTERAASKCIRQEGGAVILSLQPFSEEEKLVRRELLRCALELCGGLKDVGAVHIEMLEKLADMDCGKECHLPGKIRAVREDGIIRLCGQTDQMQPKNAAVQMTEKDDTGRTDIPAVTDLPIPVPGTVQMDGWCIETELLENDPELQKQILEEKKCTKWFSYDTISNDVRLRTRKTGDYLVVNAQGGRKKLKDFFIDNKIPKEKRDQIWLLADGSHILWILGYRISEAAKVSLQAKTVMKVQIRGDETGTCSELLR